MPSVKNVSMGSTLTHTRLWHHFISEHIWIIDMYVKSRLDP
jgi:hypothetical protein